LALRAAKVSSRPAKFCGAVTLFFSAQALLMMRISVSWRSSTGLGTSVMTRTVCESMARARWMPVVYTRMLLVGIIARWMENSTSAAVRGVPSWNLTSRRISKRQMSGVSSFQLVANCGSRSNFSL